NFTSASGEARPSACSAAPAIIASATSRMRARLIGHPPPESSARRGGTLSSASPSAPRAKRPGASEEAPGPARAGCGLLARRARGCRTSGGLRRGRGRALGQGPELAEPLLEVGPDHLVHVHEHEEDLRHVVVRAVHAPRHLRPLALGREREAGLTGLG